MNICVITVWSRCNTVKFSWKCLKGHSINRQLQYSDIIMSVMASQTTGVSIVSTVHSIRRRSKKTSNSASLAFVKGIHRWPVNSPHKGPVTRKMLPFDDVVIRVRYGVSLMSSKPMSPYLRKKPMSPCLKKTLSPFGYLWCNIRYQGPICMDMYANMNIIWYVVLLCKYYMLIYVIVITLLIWAISRVMLTQYRTWCYYLDCCAPTVYLHLLPGKDYFLSFIQGS